jgi:hypothetical protein
MCRLNKQQEEIRLLVVSPWRQHRGTSGEVGAEDPAIVKEGTAKNRMTWADWWRRTQWIPLRSAHSTLGIFHACRLHRWIWGNNYKAPVTEPAEEVDSFDARPSNVGSVTCGSVAHTSVKMPRVRGHLVRQLTDEDPTDSTCGVLAWLLLVVVARWHKYERSLWLP